ADDGTVTVLSLLDYTAREIKAWQRTASGGQISEPITPRVFYSGRSIELISGSRVYSPQQTRGDRPPQTDATTPKTYDQPLFSFSVMDDIGVGTRPDSAPRFSFNIISGRHSGLDGLEVGYGINRETDFARGVQIAGIANGVEGRVEAAQIAGIANIAGADADAAQISGVANYTHGSLRGVQVGGVVNVVEGGAEAVQSAGVMNVTRGATRSVQGAGVGNVSGALEGVQSSGVFNHVIGDAQAVQIAGVVNSVYGNLDGIQISGVVNVAEDVEGIQIGLVNVGRSVNGIQIGLVNVSDEMVGLPIGLWTHVNKNGRRKVEIASNDLFPGNVSIKTGTEHFYSILTAGLNRSSDPYRWGVGGGFGGRIPVEPFYIAIEATFIKINEDELWTDKHHAVNRLQVMGGWDVTPRLTLVAGVALNLFVSQLNDGEGLVDWRPDFGTFYKSKHDDTWLRMWPGVIFGVQF
ncbi:MAG: hypothetical protein O3A46_16645, partial [Candidatus Poribacteria bacterium]|nr:hypothetical protein [Candidatus Poribacteria bacterium]